MSLHGKSKGGDVIWSAFLSAVALFGLIGLTLLNMILSFFMHIPAMNLMISYMGLVIFIGLAAKMSLMMAL